MIKLSKLFRKKCPFERIQKRYSEIFPNESIPIGSLFGITGYKDTISLVIDINNGSFKEKQKLADYLGVPVRYIWPGFKLENKEAKP